MDTEGASTVNIKSQIKLEYTDGTTRNSHETEDFDDAVILWNLLISQKIKSFRLIVPSKERFWLLVIQLMSTKMLTAVSLLIRYWSMRKPTAGIFKPMKWLYR